MEQLRNIYTNYKNRYKNELKTLEKVKISSVNKELIRKFHEYLYAKGCSEGRVVKLSWQLRSIALILNKDFSIANKDDIQRLVMQINLNKKYADNTKQDYRRIIKQFWKWFKGDCEFHPPETKWLQVKNGKLSGKIKTGDIYTRQDIQKLLDHSDNMRNKAFLLFLFESGCRIAEALNIKLGDYKVNERFAKVRVNGKTGERIITIIESVPYINQYIATHFGNNKDDSEYLWKSIGTYNHNKPLSYIGAKKLIKSAFKKAGLNKRCNPHMFRHSRATLLASHLTEVQMCLYFGWVIGSGQTSTYVHASGRDVDDALFNYYGMQEKEKIKNPAPTNCTRCNYLNASDAKYCAGCGLGLDIKTVLDDEEKKKYYTGKAFEILEEIYQNPELLKEFIEYKKNNKQ